MDIFVFGSNLAGRHGAGAAQYAHKHRGARWGQGIGWHGSSYAIPTRDWNIQTLPLEIIQQHVEAFIRFARRHPEMTFEVTPIGCGLAGYTVLQIAPMFEHMPANCRFSSSWADHMPNDLE